MDLRCGFLSQLDQILQPVYIFQFTVEQGCDRDSLSEKSPGGNSFNKSQIKPVLHNIFLLNFVKECKKFIKKNY